MLNTETFKNTEQRNKEQGIRMMNGTIYIVVYVIGFLFFIWLFFYFIPLGLYFKAKTEGLRISLFDLIRMNARRASTHDIIDCLIASEKAGIDISRMELEAAALAGCNILAIVEAMIDAKERDFDLPFKSAVQADLNGTNLLEVINEADQKRKTL